MAKHRIVTEEEVLKDLEHYRNDVARMNENMMECKYDLDDCFVSYALQNTQVQVCNLQLEILRNGGVWQFVGYTDLEGNPLKAFTFQNKFGGYSTCYKNEATGTTIFTSAVTTKGLLKKGIKRVDYLAPAWAKTRGGSVLGQCYACIYEAEYNRCTGEEQPRQIIGDHVDAA